MYVCLCIYDAHVVCFQSLSEAFVQQTYMFFLWFPACGLLFSGKKNTSNAHSHSDFGKCQGFALTRGREITVHCAKWTTWGQLQTANAEAFTTAFISVDMRCCDVWVRLCVPTWQRSLRRLVKFQSTPEMTRTVVHPQHSVARVFTHTTEKANRDFARAVAFQLSRQNTDWTLPSNLFPQDHLILLSLLAHSVWTWSVLVFSGKCVRLARQVFKKNEFIIIIINIILNCIVALFVKLEASLGFFLTSFQVAS